ncbi:MAG: NnrU family protein [Pseudomonadota bacterium]
MIWLILGLILFLGIHSVRIFAPSWRDAIIENRGENAWKGPYTIVSLAGFGLIVLGFYLGRADADIVYVPPDWGRSLALMIMLPVFILLAAGNGPVGYIKKVLKHPMVVAIGLWAIVHLAANGDQFTVSLAAAFLVWIIAMIVSIQYRPATEIPPEKVSVRGDIMAIVGGFVLYTLFVWKLHEWLIGVPVIV